jgi:hypothetical protein
MRWWRHYCSAQLRPEDVDRAAEICPSLTRGGNLDAGRLRLRPAIAPTRPAASLLSGLYHFEFGDHCDLNCVIWPPHYNLLCMYYFGNNFNC